MDGFRDCKAATGDACLARAVAAPGIVPRACLDALHSIRTQHPGGRCVSPRCLSFLSRQSRVGVFSLFLCQGVRARDPRPLFPRCLSLRLCWRRSRPFGRVPCRRTRSKRTRLGGPSGTSSRHDFGVRWKIRRPRTSSTTSRTSRRSPRRAKCPSPTPRSRSMWTSWGEPSPLLLPRHRIQCSIRRCSCFCAEWRGSWGSKWTRRSRARFSICARRPSTHSRI